MPLLGDWDYRSREGVLESDSGAWSLFRVPDHEVWHILSIWVEAEATATAGTRALALTILDDTDDRMYAARPGATLTAGQQRDFLFAPGLPDLTSFRDTDLLLTPIPAGLILRPGWGLFIEYISGFDLVDDSDATSDIDTLTIQIVYASQATLSTVGGTPQSSDN